MALFKKKEVSQPAPPPPPKTCVCGATVRSADFSSHLDTHITEVLTPTGDPGRSFDCPLCGPSDLVYGQPGEHPISLRNMSQAMFRQHCRDAHGVDL